MNYISNPRNRPGLELSGSSAYLSPGQSGYLQMFGNEDSSRPVLLESHGRA